jgi:hypothetical protein
MQRTAAEYARANVALRGDSWFDHGAARERYTVNGERAMSKGLDKKREAKKKPQKSLQEKRAAKREKKQSRGFQGL